MSHTKTSKFISLVLRHKPEEIGITLDKNGWADVRKLLAGLSKHGHTISMDILEEIVREDEKQRYSFNDDKTKIRANQGHSINVDVELEKIEPPSIVYHGTADRFVDSIYEKGLVPMSRLYVHLSRDTETAKKVGARHGNVAIFEVDAGAMARDGYEFFCSANGVILTKEVPIKYMKRIFDFS